MNYAFLIKLLTLIILSLTFYPTHTVHCYCLKISSLSSHLSPCIGAQFENVVANPLRKEIYEKYLYAIPYCMLEH